MKFKFNKREIIIAAIMLVVGLIAGRIFFHHTAKNETVLTEHVHEEGEATIWTCAMHPQIKMDQPGDCPICGMELIPLETEKEDEMVHPDAIKMSVNSMKLGEVEMAEVKKGIPEKNVYLLGKVKPDERNISELTARFGGRIEKLFVNYTGQNVEKGEKLATIYSPELVTAQKELLEAAKYKGSNPAFYKAAVSKLKLWDLTETQINSIVDKGEPILYFDVESPIRGTVTMRHVALGDYVKEGSPLFEVIDLTHIWVMFEAYETDLPWIRTGDKINFNIRSLPGREFSAKVTFIDPFIDPKTRIAQVRVEVNNPGIKLKPEMYADGIVNTRIEGILNEIMIPKSAVLWTGKRAVVYVKVPGDNNMAFTYREVGLGAEAGNYYVVHHGLEEGETIVVNGVFKVDAAAQLEGKPSMMNPAGGKSSTGHNHGGMKMDGDKKMKM